MTRSHVKRLFVLLTAAVCLDRHVTETLLLTVVDASSTSSSPATTGARRRPWIVDHSSAGGQSSVWNRLVDHRQFFSTIRGGGTSSSSSTSLPSSEKDHHSDEERYSRQVYTLGARAHGLVRSSTIYVDGPIASGLLWECCKNLALSGVGRLVLILNDHNQDDDDDNNINNKINAVYHDATLDDLGRTYIRGAMAELDLLPHAEDEMGDVAFLDDDNVDSLTEVWVEFMSRLNPSLQVSTMTRTEFQRPTTTLDDEETVVAAGSVFLCIDRPYSTQLEWNDYCRSIPTKSLSFVSVETAGVYGRVFCDFGPRHEIHDLDGETPLVIPLDRVQILEANDDDNNKSIKPGTLIVKTVNGERHDVSRDDIILFQRSDGSLLEHISLKVTAVRTPEHIEVQLQVADATDDTHSDYLLQRIAQEINEYAVSFSRQKQVQEISFVTLKQAIQQVQNGGSELFTPCDLDKAFDQSRRNAIFGCFQTLNAFTKKHKRLPSMSSLDNDRRAFSDLGSENFVSFDESNEKSHHCQTFLETCRAKFVPLQGIFGAIASQECLKAVSGLYNPVQQFILYDCDEVLPAIKESNESALEEDVSLVNGVSYIFGPGIAERLQNRKLFVVGSGAIGCEILKNLAGMNAGIGHKGAIVVTDMDTIEKSNLSRQLLFRDADIGKFKSKAAQEAVHRMNPQVTLECHTSKVGDMDEPGPFDDIFWSKGVDVVLNALDNMEARLFMDAQCVANKKALVDAGTLGSKGNVQVVVPHESESYGSSADPPEAAIPVCTLKNFPYAISHTIQWGRDLFDGLFVRRPRQANQYAEILREGGIGELADKLEHDLGEQVALETAIELTEDLQFTKEIVDHDELQIKAHSIRWAVALSRHLFFHTIEALLREHPIDCVDEDGEPFWSGSRKMPKAVSFMSAAADDTQQEAINKNLVDFVRSAARLRYETYNGIPSNPRENASLVDVEVVAKALNEKDSQAEDAISEHNESTESPEEENNALMLRQAVSDLESFRGLPQSLAVAEFEKDDDSNDHVNFITAASNLRAICYGIPPVDAMETRRVAGKIVPAMITTTAFVSALSCLELVKLVQDDVPLRRYRNAFINLALPFFAFTSPLPADDFPGWRGKTHTLWDRISVKESQKAFKSGGLTLRRLLSRLQKKVDKENFKAVQVSTISCGPFMVYANFLNEDDDELLDRSIWEVVEEAAISGTEFDHEFSRDGEGSSGDSTNPLTDLARSSFLDLAVVVEDGETGEEVELPPVRIHRYKKNE